MAKCYGHFEASGYSAPYPDTYEVWDSIKAAEESLRRRVYRGRDRVDRRQVGYQPTGAEWFDFPCAKDDAQITLWVGVPDPTDPYPCDAANHYPDYLLTVGKYGGIKRERA